MARKTKKSFFRSWVLVPPAPHAFIRNSVTTETYLRSKKTQLHKSSRDTTSLLRHNQSSEKIHVETAAINHRVADFLKQYAPFHEMEEADLLELAKHGRVRFYERHQYVLAPGSSRVQGLVIQQGTVLLWDERSNDAKLLDVRGAGDLLGVDQVNNGSSHPYAARTVSDVLIYAFPTSEFNALVEKYSE